MRPLWIACLVATLAACAAGPTRDTAAPPSVTGHPNINATAWMQQSAEYAAVTMQIFRQACDALDALIAAGNVTALTGDEQGDTVAGKPPAVIVDLDETMLDNSPYQARRIVADGGYTSESWAQWVSEADAKAVPGALDYARCAQARGVTLIYLSNRKTPGEYDGTVENLRELDFPLPADPREVVLLRGDERAPEHDKGTRRRWVGKRYRVLQLVGDNLGDFLDHVERDPRGAPVGTAARRALVAPYGRWWGTRWFMLPNPSYGSWENALIADCGDDGLDATECKRSRLDTN